MKNPTLLIVDSENAAVEWWDVLTERFPFFARLLLRSPAVVVSDAVVSELESLLGWTGGPEYAPTPLRVLPEGCPEWDNQPVTLWEGNLE